MSMELFGAIGAGIDLASKRQMAMERAEQQAAQFELMIQQIAESQLRQQEKQWEIDVYNPIKAQNTIENIYSERAKRIFDEENLRIRRYNALREQYERNRELAADAVGGFVGRAFADSAPVGAPLPMADIGISAASGSMTITPSARRVTSGGNAVVGDEILNPGLGRAGQQQPAAPDDFDPEIDEPLPRPGAVEPDVQFAPPPAYFSESDAQSGQQPPIQQTPPPISGNVGEAMFNLLDKHYRGLSMMPDTKDKRFLEMASPSLDMVAEVAVMNSQRRNAPAPFAIPPRPAAESLPERYVAARAAAEAFVVKGGAAISNIVRSPQSERYLVAIKTGASGSSASDDALLARFSNDLLDDSRMIDGAVGAFFEPMLNSELSDALSDTQNARAHQDLANVIRSDMDSARQILRSTLFRETIAKLVPAGVAAGISNNDEAKIAITRAAHSFAANNHTIDPITIRRLMSAKSVSDVNDVLTGGQEDADVINRIKVLRDLEKVTRESDANLNFAIKRQISSEVEKIVPLESVEFVPPLMPAAQFRQGPSADGADMTQTQISALMLGLSPQYTYYAPLIYQFRDSNDETARKERMNAEKMIPFRYNAILEHHQQTMRVVEGGAPTTDEAVSRLALEAQKRIYTPFFTELREVLRSPSGAPGTLDEYMMAFREVARNQERRTKMLSLLERTERALQSMDARIVVDSGKNRQTLSLDEYVQRLYEESLPMSERVRLKNGTEQ